MKNYRNSIAALVLALAFSTSAFADEGVLHTDKTPPPPPQQQEQQTTGVIWTEAAETTPEDDTLTEITLSLLQTLVSLL